MKHCIREDLYNPEDRSQIYWYTPRLCDRAEITNRSCDKPYVPFIQIDEKSFEENFNPTDLISSDPEKKLLARNAVRSTAHIMYHCNESKICQNFKNVAKKLTSNRVFTFCGKELKDCTKCRIILEQIFFIDCSRILTLVIVREIAKSLCYEDKRRVSIIHRNILLLYLTGKHLKTTCI